MSNASASPGRQAGKRSAAAPGTTSVEERSVALVFLSSLAAEVSGGTVNLPSFPDVVIRIRKALADPDAKLSQLVKIVGSEPRLAARLIQAANSAAFNPAGKSLTDLRAAITRLGHRPVQSSAMAFAVRQMRLAPALRSISKPLNLLWEESISVASICQVIARRTKINPDEAFLTGLLHGIGRLYIMVRAAGKSDKLWRDSSFIHMVDGWHPAIGKAVLENWGFVEEMAQAVGDQRDYDRGSKSEVDLTDVLIVSIALTGVLREPGPRKISMEGISSFRRLNLTAPDCSLVLQHAEHQLGALHASLGC
jgi:HD-like signal output (HDOD) protein